MAGLFESPRDCTRYTALSRVRWRYSQGSCPSADGRVEASPTVSRPPSSSTKAGDGPAHDPYIPAPTQAQSAEGVRAGWAPPIPGPKGATDPTLSARTP